MSKINPQKTPAANSSSDFWGMGFMDFTIRQFLYFKIFRLAHNLNVRLRFCVNIVTYYESPYCLILLCF